MQLKVNQKGIQHYMWQEKTTCYLISMNLGQNSARMKCCFHLEQNHFLDYFDDSAPDGAVIYTSDVPFQIQQKKGQVNRVHR